ncbi:hypothetical protein ACSQ67_015343 [Phaseolus vulgaris]
MQPNRSWSFVSAPGRRRTSRRRFYQGGETMDHFGFNQTLFLVGALSCLLLSTIAAARSTPLNSGSRRLLAVTPELTHSAAAPITQSSRTDTIAPLLDGSFDPVKALETEMKATLRKAGDIAASISKRLQDPTTKKNALDALNIRKSRYEDMLDEHKRVFESGGPA